jgi:putative sigma-54 modulation protein
MQLNITFRQMTSSDALREHTKERVERVNKYLDGTVEAHVVLAVEKHVHHADITIHSGRFVLRGKEKTEDMYASVDLAMDKIERQLRRYKDRLKHHHGKEKVHHRQDLVNHLKVRHDVLAVSGPELPQTDDVSPRVVRTNDLLLRSLSVEEAVMQMDLMNNDFFVFTNAQSKEMNVVYRRKDGHYGLIEASAAKNGAAIP